MQNTKLLLTSFTFVGLLALAGCSFPGVYKIDIQQGNVVTQDMIDQLRPGMTRRQVRFIMGNPLLTDTFHADRWDYLYSLQPGGGERQQERVSVIFNGNDQLVSLSGDFMPGVSRDEALLGKENGTNVTALRRKARSRNPKYRPSQALCSTRSRKTSMAWKRFPSQRHNLWTPARSKCSALNKKPGTPGFLLPASWWPTYEFCCLASAALAARNLRISLGSASKGR